MTKVIEVDVEKARAAIEERTFKLLEYFQKDGRTFARVEVPDDYDPDDDDD